MNDFLSAIFAELSRLKLEQATTLYSLIALNAALLLFFILGFFIKNIGKKDKSPAFFFAFAFYALVFWRAYYLPQGEEIRAYTLATLFEFSVFIAFFGAMKIQNYALSEINDKRIIGEDIEDLDEIRRRFDAPVRRIEILRAGKLSDEAADVGIDPSEIKNYVNKLREKPLTIDEEDELDKLEADLEKYSARKMGEVGKGILSSRMEKMLKMLSRYNVD